jgi:hypothetical protein
MGRWRCGYQLFLRKVIGAFRYDIFRAKGRPPPLGHGDGPALASGIDLPLPDGPRPPNGEDQQ